MAVGVFVTLVSVGCIGLTVAILLALSGIRSRRVDLERRDRDPALADAMREVQANIEKGQRGY